MSEKLKFSSANEKSKWGDLNAIELRIFSQWESFKVNINWDLNALWD